MCNSNFDLNKVEAEAMALLEKMTAEERFDLVASGDPDMPGASNTIMAIKRLGIPEINLADATGGISVNFRTAFGNTKEPTAFPCPMLLAATWNTELSLRMPGLWAKNAGHAGYISCSDRDQYLPVICK